MSATDQAWAPIAAAPRDGSEVELIAMRDGSDDDYGPSGIYRMRWMAPPGGGRRQPATWCVVGAAGSVLATWTESGGMGPTHWRRPPADPAAPAAPWTPTHRHYKGGLYRLLGYGRHSETLDDLAIYQDAQGGLWARPKAMFDEPGRFVLLPPAAVPA